MGLRLPENVPLLTDGVVTLRAHRPEDLDAIVEQCSDPEMLRFTTVPRPYGKPDAEDFLEKIRNAWEDPSPTTVRYWAISTTSDSGAETFAGSIDYRPTGVGTATVGWFAVRHLPSTVLKVVVTATATATTSAIDTTAETTPSMGWSASSTGSAALAVH